MTDSIPTAANMPLSPGLRKLGLTFHLVASLGWLGAVAVFLALSLVGQNSRDPATVHAVYLVMNLVGEWVIVPFSLFALLTGLVQSIGTTWGLVRHYWILVKLALTVGATALLLLHQFTAVAQAARRVAATPAAALPGVDALATSLVLDAGGALLVLLAATVLAVYKPWGPTPFGRRAAAAGGWRSGAAPGPTEGPATRPPMPRSLKLFLLATGVALAVFGVLHHVGHAAMHHWP